MWAARPSTASASRKESGITRRRLAESSRLRSSHWVAALSGPLRLSVISRPGEAAHPLGAHRVALVGHGGGAHLLGVERLRELAHALEQAEVGAELVAGLGEAGQGLQHLAVLLARIGLAGHREALGEPELPRDPAVELAHLGAVALEQGRGSSPACRWSP